MNVYDSERMGSVLRAKGFIAEPDLAKADVVLINTCSIRDKSEHKVLSLLGQLKPLKAKNPNKVIGITGCVGQRMGRSLLQRVPHLDLVMGPDGVDRVGELLDEVVLRGRRVVDTQMDPVKSRQYSQPLLREKSRPNEFLTIIKGCDHFCTYCIVPFVRGREKSRSIAEILTDVEKLVAGGTKEVTFLGQNINTFGKGTSETLAQLINASDAISGLERIRYVTSHPRDLGDDLITQFGSVEKLCPALHLPFQSGSNRILKAMARLYTREEYLVKIEKLRKACPDIAMSTDVIVGFPGETEEDFEETLAMIRQVGFSGLYLFKYSPRPGTRAFGLEELVPDSVAGERFDRVHAAAYEIINRENQAAIGRHYPCLIESVDRKGGDYLMARTLSNKVVHVLNAGPACVGKIVDVEIVDANQSNLKGYYTGAPRPERTETTPRKIPTPLPLSPAFA